MPPEPEGIELILIEFFLILTAHILVKKKWLGQVRSGHQMTMHSNIFTNASML